MLSALLAVLFTAASPPPPAVASLDDVRALVDAGRPDTEVAAAVRASGLYLEMPAEQVVRLYFDGVPASVLGALLSTAGEPYPKLTARGAEVELLYDGFRILGRRAPSGPVLVVSGFARDGSRLKPPVEAPPAPERRVAEHAVPEPRVIERAAYAEVPVAASLAEPAYAVAPRYELPSWPEPDRRGAPEFVSVTEVRGGSITGGSIVLPLPGAYTPYGYGYGFSSGHGHPRQGYGGGAYGSACGAPAGGYVSYSFSPPGRQHHGGGGSRARVVRDRLRR